MVDLKELRKDDVVLFETYPGGIKNGGCVNKITKNQVVVHWCNPVLCVNMMALVDKKDIFQFPIGDSLNPNFDKPKGLTKSGEDTWEYKGKVIKYLHELQNALWDNGIECWPKGTCDEEKEVEL